MVPREKNHGPGTGYFHEIRKINRLFSRLGGTERVEPEEIEKAIRHASLQGDPGGLLPPSDTIRKLASWYFDSLEGIRLVHLDASEEPGGLLWLSRRLDTELRALPVGCRALVVLTGLYRQAHTGRRYATRRLRAASEAKEHLEGVAGRVRRARRLEITIVIT